MTTTNLFTNRATAKLAVALTSGDSAVTLVPGGGDWFPSPGPNEYFRLVVQKGSGQSDQREYMLCTSRAGDVLTVTRAQEGTPAANFDAGDEASLVVTAMSFGEFPQKQGMVLQGALEVEAEPTTPMGVANKEYVDATTIDDVPDDGLTYGRMFGAWDLLGDAASLPIPIPVDSGGTGGVTLDEAQLNLIIARTSIDDLAPTDPPPKYGDRWIKPSNMSEMVWVPNQGVGGVWINPADAGSEAYPIAVNKGGTGAITADAALTNLGGTTVGKGVFTAASAAAARTVLGIDTLLTAGYLPLTGASAMTGALKLADGTVAAPGLAWNSEPGLGWFRSGANTLGFAMAGAQVGRMKADTATLTRMDLYPRAAGSTSVVLNATVAGAVDVYNFEMFIQPDGVGILRLNNGGATTPKGIGYTAAWHTFNNVVQAPRFQVDADTFWTQTATDGIFAWAPNWYWQYGLATGQLSWNRDGGPSTRFATNGDFFGGRDIWCGTDATMGLVSSDANTRYLRFTLDNWRLQFATASGHLQYVNNSGNVLFTVDPSGAITSLAGIASGGVLTTHANNGPSLFFDSASHNYMRMAPGGSASAAWAWAWDRTNGDLKWNNGSSQTTFMIRGDGYLITQNGIDLVNLLGIKGAQAKISFRSAAGTEQANIQDQGNGTLRINSQGHLVDFQTDGNLVVQAGGTATKPGGGDWNVLSDPRLKTVEAAYTRGLEDILAYRPITFRYKNDPDRVYVGRLSTDVKAVDPSMIFITSNEDYNDLEAIDGTPDKYKIINAIKTLHQRLAALENA